MMNKRGDYVIYETVIFIVLNIAFFTMLLFFAYRPNLTSVYEQTYAKEIALLIDGAKPEMLINIEFEGALKIANENKINPKEIVTIKDNNVRVNLAGKGGYSYAFFSDYDVKIEISGIRLKITVEEKK